MPAFAGRRARGLTRGTNPLRTATAIGPLIPFKCGRIIELDHHAVRI
jgi:hypothetical protein